MGLLQESIAIFEHFLAWGWDVSCFVDDKYTPLT